MSTGEREPLIEASRMLKELASLDRETWMLIEHFNWDGVAQLRELLAAPQPAPAGELEVCLGYVNLYGPDADRLGSSEVYSSVHEAWTHRDEAAPGLPGCRHAGACHHLTHRRHRRGEAGGAGGGGEAVRYMGRRRRPSYLDPQYGGLACGGHPRPRAAARPAGRWGE